MPYAILILGLGLLSFLSHVSGHTTAIYDFTCTSNLNPNWAFFTAGDQVCDDGLVSLGKHGFTVISPGTVNGHPAFTLEADSDLDHVKWLVLSNRTASSGYTGYVRHGSSHVVRGSPARRGLRS